MTNNREGEMNGLATETVIVDDINHALMHGDYPEGTTVKDDKGNSFVMGRSFLLPNGALVDPFVKYGDGFTGDGGSAG